jgi:acetylglutamate kinase
VGGTILDETVRRDSIAREIAAAHHEGHSIAVVHGGGKQLTQFLQERGVESRFINGLRVTTAEAIDAVLKVLAGSVNKQFVGALRAAGVNAVGLSGMDGRLADAVRMSEELGLVGNIQHVDPALIELLIAAAYLPVIACVAGDNTGRAWNINADRMAVACAQAICADALIFLTDVAGVMDEAGKVLPDVTVAEALNLISRGVARGGMQAKLEAACDAARGGINSVMIVSGTEKGSINRLFSGIRTGTRLQT